MASACGRAVGTRGRGFELRARCAHAPLAVRMPNRLLTPCEFQEGPGPSWTPSAAAPVPVTAGDR
eukprot:1211466-Prymnesium_polylepis.1